MVCLGLAEVLMPTHAHAGGKGAIWFGAGVVTGIAIHETIKHQNRPRWHAGPNYYNPPPRARRTARSAYYSHTETIRIQTALNALGHDAGTVDGVVGRGTIAATRAFQVSIDGAPTGVLTAKQKIALYDRATAVKPDNKETVDPKIEQSKATEGVVENPDGVEEQNIAGERDVEEVQDALNALGYPAGTADGILGDETRVAIKAFQTDLANEASGTLTDLEYETLIEQADELASVKEGPETEPLAAESNVAVDENEIDLADVDDEDEDDLDDEDTDEDDDEDVDDVSAKPVAFVPAGS